MSVVHLPPTATGEEAAAALARDGAVIVDRVAAPEVMDRVRSDLEPYLARTAPGRDEFSGRRTKRTGGLIARSLTCRDLVMHPLVLDTMGRVLAHATTFQLHLTQIIAIGPDEPAQRIHRDQWAYDFFPFPKGYEVQCNTIWAMTDFTPENGATRVIVGSHRYDDRMEFTEAHTEPAAMTKGSVLFYTGSLYHGGGSNRSEATRYGINITYNVAWLRQEENQYLSVPLEVARELPEKLLRVMGYAHGAYALGYVDDLRDPMEIVRPGSTTAGLGDLARAEAQIRGQSGV